MKTCMSVIMENGTYLIFLPLSAVTYLYFQVQMKAGYLHSVLMKNFQDVVKKFVENACLVQMENKLNI